MYEIVIRRAKWFENSLEEYYGARGNGLHSKVGSVADQLDHAVIRKLRYIATLRGKLAHEQSFSKELDLKAYIQACDICERMLCKRSKIQHSDLYEVQPDS